MTRFVPYLMCIAFAPGAQSTAEAADAPLHGHVAKTEVFAARPLANWARDIRVLGADLSARDPAAIITHSYSVTDRTRPRGAIYRWRIAHGCYWGTSAGKATQSCGLTQVPVDDLVLYDATKSVKERFRLLDKKYPQDWQSTIHHWELDPVAEFAGSVRFAPDGKGDADVERISFDFYPTSDKSCLLFILYNSKLTIWFGTAKWSRDGDWRLKWSKLETIDAPFDEEFMVCAKGDTYFFITTRGKVYFSKKPEKGPRKVDSLWTDVDRPVSAFITDGDRDKTYVFLKNKKALINAKDSFFELDEKPVLVEFDPTTLKKFVAEEPLRTVLQYAHVLEEKLKAKQPAR